MTQGKAASSAAKTKKTSSPKAADTVSKSEFNNLSGQVSQMAEAQSQVLEMISGLSEAVSNLAKNNPVSITKGVESTEFQTGNEPEVLFNTVGDEHDAELSIQRSAIADPDSPAFHEKAKNLAFMAEKVTVLVQESDDPRADEVIEVSVNGRSEIFRRGIPKTVTRMFVEGLARAKPVKYGNRHRVNPDTGVEEVVNRSTTGQRYPFTVIEDRNPMGQSWLQAVLAQRA